MFASKETGEEKKNKGKREKNTTRGEEGGEPFCSTSSFLTVLPKITPQGNRRRSGGGTKLL